jgi:hypothetical protein
MALLNTYNFAHFMLRKACKINVSYVAERVSRGALKIQFRSMLQDNS